MKVFSTLLIILVVSATQGCSTTPVSSYSAESVPSDRRYSGYSKPCDGCGTVVLVRDSGFMGAACSVTAIFNGQPVAKLNPGEKITMYAKPGQHVIEAEPGFCAGTRMGVSVLLDAGQTLKYRIGRDHNGSIMLVPSY